MFLVPVIGWHVASKTYSFVASAVSNSGSVTIPVSAQSGDFAILGGLTNDSTSSMVPAESGWTEIASLATLSPFAAAVLYKVLAGGDPGAGLTLDTGGDLANNIVMLVFRPSADAASVASISTWNKEATGGNPSSQNVAASGGAGPLIVFGFAGVVSGTAAFSTASPAFDDTVANGNGDLMMGYKIYNSAPSDHSIDMNDLGSSNHLMSGYVQFAS